MAVNRKYEVEVWYQGTTLLGEIGRLLNSFSWTETRNGVGGIDFNIDESVLKEYCDQIGEEPKVFLQLKNTDIKVKRNGAYRIGGFVNDFPDPNLNQGNSTVSISADGYLNLLSDQITQVTSYANTETTDIAWDLVDKVTNRTGSALGITKDTTNWFVTGVNRDRKYDNDQYVKDLLVALTSLGDGSNDFDFRFTPFRGLQTFDFNNPTVHSLAIEYPAPRKGIGALQMNIGVISDMANRVVVKGSGQGEATISVTVENSSSIETYGIHEAVVSYSDVTDAATLTEKANAILAVKSYPILLPKATVNGSEFDVSSIHAGDLVRVINNKSPWFAVDGYFRIEEMKVNIDSNSNEEVELTLSNLNLPDIS